MKFTVTSESAVMRSASLLPAVLALLALSGCGGGDRSEARTAAVEAETARAEAAREDGERGPAEEGKHVKLTVEQIQTADIGLAQAGPAQIRERLPLFGVIMPNAEQVREVAARFPGAIRTVAKRVGDPVRKGEALATVESNESLQTYAVIAPLSGVITARNANPGEQAGDRSLFTVADLSTVWVELSVFPRDVARIRVGQSVRAKSAETGQSADGKVVYVAPFGTSSNQTLNARVLLDNAQGKWPPGLYVAAQVTLASAAVPLAVSSNALQTLEDRTVVFVQTEDGFEPRALELGRTDGDLAEVRTGLEPGETYATKNSFILKAELGKGEADED